jgi:formate dehydrogenase gamma subunit
MHFVIAFNYSHLKLAQGDLAMRKVLMLLLIISLFSFSLLIDNQAAATLQDELSSETCFECHEDADMVGEDAVAHAATFETATHSADMGVECIDCHTELADVEDIYEHGPLEAATCTNCHEQVVESYNKSAHNTRTFKDNRAECSSCHGPAHDISYETDSADKLMSPQRQPETCGECHRESLVDKYMMSTHGNLLTEGSEDGPTCMTCHSGYLELEAQQKVAEIDMAAINRSSNIDFHNIKIADLQRNPVFKLEMLFKCSSCHSESWEQFRYSAHSVALLENNVIESACCTCCHSSHQILPPSNPESTVYPTKIQQDCRACHADERLVAKLGMNLEVVDTFEQSYHGRAGTMGGVEAANCASCHNNHSIFAHSDPRSSVHPDNLQQTCGDCHPDASENFVQGIIHTEKEEGGTSFWANLVKNVYVWLIIVVIGGMVVHNLMDFWRKLHNRSKRMRKEPAVERLSKLERITHAILIFSFFLLVYTGFALVWPKSWWVWPLNTLGPLLGIDGEIFRSLTHRIAGVLLSAISIYHVGYLAFHKRGREQLGHMLPRKRDLRDVFHNIAWFIGKRKERPEFDRFSYMEKAEYWALVWGTIVMMITGAILMFPVLTTSILPGEIWNIALVIHFYEAILATLAIIAWHFYFVMFNPDESPLSMTFINGRMLLEELQHCHPEEFKRIEKEKEDKS